MRTGRAILPLWVSFGWCAVAFAGASASQPQVTLELQQAEALFRAGKRTAAVELVERYTRRHASDPKARFTAGLILASAGSFAKAANEFKATTELQPNYDAYYNLGLCESHLERWQDARVAYFQALDANLDAYEPNVRLALDYLAQKKPYLAVPWLLKARRLRPEDETVMYMLGDAWIREGYLESAAQMLQQLVARRPADPRAHAILGDALAKMQRFNEALAEYQRAEELAPTVAEIHYQIGQVEGKLSQSREAEASFRRAIELDPKLSRAWGALGEEVMITGRWSEAEPFLEKALRLDPDDVEADFDLSKGLIQAKKYARAKVILEHLAREHPDDSRFPYQLSRVYQGLGLSDRAAAALQTFERLNRDSLSDERVQHPRTYIQ